MSDPEEFCLLNWVYDPNHPDYEESSNDDEKLSPVYATLHFYHDDPDSMRRYRVCNQAEDALMALREFDNELRRRWKYGEEAAQMMTVEQARGLLWASLNRYDINLDE